MHFAHATLDESFFSKKKKEKRKTLCFYYIYNFYFVNLIYKWISNFKTNKRVLFFSKKNSMFLLYIYNFYFVNLIYK